YPALADFGRVLDPANVRRQAPGGVTQVLGQALIEIAPTPEALQAAPPSVMNAIVDALSAFPRAENLPMPARPAEVWAAVAAGVRAE
ncbi:MAG: hypothetical protein ACLPSW_07835, partial [Roseiarcus sp.]